ncbi:MAG: GNAT family N-acetyltransferase [Paracoccus sp. (in: a-proteobacteria)]|nr:GNAT family N-acetyltransferase [Paracoccus sp. (in: a-proteobacteria)]
MNAGRIRDARPGDAAAIAAIWNPVIRDSAVTLRDKPRPEAEIRAEIAAGQNAGHGFFVWEDADGIGGFASYGQFRTGGGYARSMEHTIYVSADHQGQGIADALLGHLEAHARAGGARLMVGAMTGDNDRSISFHARHGYAVWGRLPAAGFKLGQWHELVLMFKDLETAGHISAPG